MPTYRLTENQNAWTVVQDSPPEGEGWEEIPSAGTEPAVEPPAPAEPEPEPEPAPADPEPVEATEEPA